MNDSGAYPAMRARPSTEPGPVRVQAFPQRAEAGGGSCTKPSVKAPRYQSIFAGYIPLLSKHVALVLSQSTQDINVFTFNVPYFISHQKNSPLDSHFNRVDGRKRPRAKESPGS